MMMMMMKISCDVAAPCTGADVISSCSNTTAAEASVETWKQAIRSKPQFTRRVNQPTIKNELNIQLRPMNG